MNLKLLVPFQVFAEKSDVLRIVAETPQGSFGLLPHRLDCVAALAAGILVYETEDEGEVFVAVDEGVLVKTGAEKLADASDSHRRQRPDGVDSESRRTSAEHGNPVRRDFCGRQGGQA